MANTYLRQSPLAHLSLAGLAQPDRGEAGVAMQEKPFRGLVNLRGRSGNRSFMSAVKKALKLALPTEANTTASAGDVTIAWLGPDEWLVITPDAGPETAAKLRKALADRQAAVTDVSESRTCVQISGPRAREAIAKGCPIDLHPRVFGVGRCAQSHLSKAGILLLQIDEAPTFDLYVVRSFAEYLWLWLEDASLEYGVVVLED